MVNQLNNMALKLFVDPNEGGRAYARGIEKAFDSVGDAVGGILQSYNDRRVKNEAALGQLVANDPDGFLKQDGILPMKPKEQNQLLKDYYSETYPKLSDKDTVLEQFQTAKKQRLEEIELETKLANLDVAKTEVARAKLFDPEQAKRLQTLELTSKELAVEQQQMETDRLKDYDNLLNEKLENFDTLVNYDGGDYDSATGALIEMESLISRNPTHPKAVELEAKVKTIKGSPVYQQQMKINESRAKSALEKGIRAEDFVRRYDEFIKSDRIDPINIEALKQEQLTGKVGEQTKLLRMYEYIDGIKGEMRNTGNPILKLKEIGVTDPDNFLLGMMDETDANGDPVKRKVDPEILAKDILKYEQHLKEKLDPEPSQLNDITNMFVRMEASSRFDGEPSELLQEQQNALEAQTNAINGLGDFLQLMEASTRVDNEADDKQILEHNGLKVRSGYVAKKIDDLRKYYGAGGEVQVFFNEVQKLVPEIARGIFGEKGVLTDTDAKRYASMIADPERPIEFNKILIEMLRDQVRQRVEVTVKNYTGQGKDLSGLIPMVAGLMEKKTGTAEQMMESINAGELVIGSKYFTQRINPATGKPAMAEFVLNNPKAALSSLRQFQKELDVYRDLSAKAYNQGDINRKMQEGASLSPTIQRYRQRRHGGNVNKQFERGGILQERDEQEAMRKMRLFSPPSPIYQIKGN